MFDRYYVTVLLRSSSPTVRGYQKAFFFLASAKAFYEKQKLEKDIKFLSIYSWKEGRNIFVYMP